MHTFNRELVTRLYRQILFREPDVGGLDHYTSRLEARELLPDQVEEALRSAPEFSSVLSPLVEEIETVYRTYLLRAPSPQEVGQAVENFRNALPSFAQSVQAIKAGKSRAYLGIRPLNLEMDITNQCNLRCIMCYFSDERIYKRKRVDISVEEFASIAGQLFPLCHKVSLSIGTEPLLHHHFDELVAITESHRVPRTYINTNGLLLNETLIEQMVKSRFHAMAISIDAATKETYERIRVGSRFEKIIDNIKAVNRAKERAKSDVPHLTFNFVLMKSNIEELPALVRMAKELQIEGIAAVHMVAYDNTNTEHESLERHKELCNRCLDFTREAAKECNVRVELPNNFELGPRRPLANTVTPTYFDLNTRVNKVVRSCCQFPWHFVGIDCDGNVVPCGWWYREPPMGNIKNDRFEDIWNNARYRNLRAEHMSGSLRKTCSTCPAAGVGNVSNTSAFTVKSPGLVVG
jgi:radical SAM protein with 4Fe4S-binding SPASM domain